MIAATPPCLPTGDCRISAFHNLAADVSRERPRVKRRILTALIAAALLTLGTPASAAPRPTPVPKTPHLPAPTTTTTLGLPVSPGTRISQTYPITPGFTNQGISLEIPAGHYPVLMGWFWGPDNEAMRGGVDKPPCVEFRSTNAYLIAKNSRDGYVWHVVVLVDAGTCAPTDASITTWAIYI